MNPRTPLHHGHVSDSYLRQPALGAWGEAWCSSSGPSGVPSAAPYLLIDSQHSSYDWQTLPGLSLSNYIDTKIEQIIERVFTEIYIWLSLADISSLEISTVELSVCWEQSRTLQWRATGAPQCQAWDGERSTDTALNIDQHYVSVGQNFNSTFTS